MGSETRRATKLMTFRLTPEEHAVVHAAAESRGVGPTAWARRLLLRAAKAPVPPVAARKDRSAAAVAAVLGELGRIGNNVNQVAKIANRSGDADLSGFTAMLEELRTIRAAVISTIEPR